MAVSESMLKYPERECGFVHVAQNKAGLVNHGQQKHHTLHCTLPHKDYYAMPFL